VISLPKNFSVEKVAEYLRDLVCTLENQVNGGIQIYVVDRVKHTQYPRNPKRRDLLVRIRQRQGVDTINLYWFDGKVWQPLKLNNIDGQVSGDQITDFSFLDLDDTPDSYLGQAGKVVAVNALETALEFVDATVAAGGSDECCEILVQDNVTGPVPLTLEDESDYLYSDQISTVP